MDRVPEEPTGELDPATSSAERAAVLLVSSAESVGVPSGAVLLDLTVRRGGGKREIVATFSTVADPRSADDLRQVLVDAIRRRGGDEAQIAEYEMELR